jgi:hypothetical protein
MLLFGVGRGPASSTTNKRNNSEINQHKRREKILRASISQVTEGGHTQH